MALCAILCSLEITAFNEVYSKVRRKIPFTKEVLISQKKIRSLRNFLLNRRIFFNIVLKLNNETELNENLNMKVIKPTKKKLQINFIESQTKNRNILASIVPNKIDTYQV